MRTRVAERQNAINNSWTKKIHTHTQQWYWKEERTRKKNRNEELEKNE